MNVEELMKILSTVPPHLLVMFNDLGTDQQPAYVEAKVAFTFNDGECIFLALKT